MVTACFLGPGSSGDRVWSISCLQALFRAFRRDMYACVVICFCECVRVCVNEINSRGGCVGKRNGWRDGRLPALNVLNLSLIIMSAELSGLLLFYCKWTFSARLEKWPSRF